MSDDDPCVLVLGPKTRGRPRAMAGPGARVMTWVPRDLHRELARRAAQHPDQSMSAVVRDMLQKAIRR